jgi:hypothetical protein
MGFFEIALEFAKWGSALLLIAAVKLLWDVNRQMIQVLSTIGRHDSDIAELRSNLESVKSSYISRFELQEAIRRIELLIENFVLKSNHRHDD